MTTYAEYFLNRNNAVGQLELIEISHPNMSQVYYIVRNKMDGVTVLLEDGSPQFFQYYPLKIEVAGVADNLDQIYNISLGDLGEIMPKELDLITAADGFDTPLNIKYRTYRTDNLNVPMITAIDLEVITFTFTREGCQFTAQSPQLNVNSTGEVYDLDRFPMLAGTL